MEIGRMAMGLSHDQMAVKPPILLLGCLLFSLGLEGIFPLSLAPTNETVRPLGMAFVIVALGLFFWALGAFRAVGEQVKPESETQALVQTGPYRFSRNPIYVAMAMLVIGVGLWSHNGWNLVLLCLCIPVIHVGVVVREESYLYRTLGEEFVDYCERVNRYL